MKKIFRPIISVLLVFSLVFALSSVAFAASGSNSGELRFGADGKFRILQLADTQDDFDTRPAMLDFIREAIKKYEPDLIVLTGDNTSGQNSKTFAKISIDNVINAFGGTPFAMVFGNHDGERIVKKEELLKLYQKHDNCLAHDDNDLYGCATYNLPIKSSDGAKIAYNLWMIDSNMYEYDEDGNNLGYDYVHPDQIDWYVKTSNELKAQNGGQPVYSMVFQHIIVNEIYDYLIPSDAPGNVDGRILNPETCEPGSALNENPCPGHTDSEQFETCVAQGDVVAMVFGHDHVNDFVVHTAEGIDLLQTPGIGMQTYGSDATRGCRIIDLDENSPRTYVSSTPTYWDVMGDTLYASVMYYASINIGWYYLSLPLAAIPFVGKQLAYKFLEYIYIKNNPLT